MAFPPHSIALCCLCLVGASAANTLSHRVGLARPLSKLLRVYRYLSVRYDGHLKVTLEQLATGLATIQKAFPVPGYLAGSHPLQNWLLD